jgi:Carbohydrate-selective porin, OprB family/S-layer homology domain
MSNLLWKSLVVSPAVLGASLLVSAAAMAAPSVANKEVAPAEVSTVETQFDTQEVSTQKVEIQENSAAIEAEQSLQKGLEKASQVTPELTPVKSLEQAIEKSPTVVAQAQNPANSGANSGEVLDQVNRYSNEGRNNNNASQGQVTSVSQFSDVQPTDWAFQALQSLVERYGCIAGYPNGTFRGNRAMTRYEFAAGLNACLDRVNELIATATADLVRKEDLATLQRLQEEFSAELATLRGRVDALEARTAELEANQFSTTTKLVGEAIFALSDVFGDRADSRNNTVFQNRVRLDLQTSFTGRDVLHTRLATGNARRFDLGTTPGASGEGNQTFNISGDANNSNDVFVDWLAYYFPLGPAQVYVAATGGIHSDYVATNNPYFEDFDGGNGALSTFASSSPIFRIGGGAGAAVSIPFTPSVGPIKGSSITVGYLGSEANNPGTGAGIFNGNYAALGQVNFSLGGAVALAATYVNGYHGTGGTLFDAGGLMGSDPVSGRSVGVVGTRAANELSTGGVANSNSYGLSAAIRPSKNLSVSGFVSYTDVGQQGANNDFEVWSWGAGVALPDFGKKGNVLGIFGGAQPYAIGRRDIVAGRETPFHVEGFYKYRLNDNISITPGVIWLMNPDQDRNAPDAVIGTLRTTFTF